ncbi:aspartate carbamoyltransferase catalytic subunit, partial [Wolbachia endosymbiont of Pentidionis agamae]|uniref:aspartate carbamoyltransferase catalytic subunit n=1 Tax=Wolbachia endosymbiont of Pentidionis agamae TaxID=3110435 RepID=UPI002FD2910E
SLGANVITIPIRYSSINKGEDLQDMIKTLGAMNPHFIIIRHKDSGIIQTLAYYIKCCIINAGNGSNEHPTQALSDYLVISKNKYQVQNLKITICGDILHSRVARSNIKLLKMFGAQISLVSPPTLSCHSLNGVDKIYYSLEEGIKEADVIMLLRLQKERMNKSCFIPSQKEYFSLYGLDRKKLSYAKNDVIIMHPGPINRNVEISDDIADSCSVILQQVEFGVAMRKAILHYFSQFFIA